MPARGMEFTEARKRMARMPQGADHIDNPISVAPGLSHRQRPRDGRRAGDFPGHARQRRADAAGPGAKLLSATVHCPFGEGVIGGPLGEIQKAHPDTIIGSYPKYRDGTFWTELVVRSRSAAGAGGRPRRESKRWSTALAARPDLLQATVGTAPTARTVLFRRQAEMSREVAMIYKTIVVIIQGKEDTQTRARLRHSAARSAAARICRRPRRAACRSPIAQRRWAFPMPPWRHRRRRTQGARRGPEIEAMFVGRIEGGRP